MPRPEKADKPNYKTMKITTENHKELMQLKPYERPLCDWFNEQLAAFIEFKKHTEGLAKG